jgi:hypothetical protein
MYLDSDQEEFNNTINHRKLQALHMASFDDGLARYNTYKKDG